LKQQTTWSNGSIQKTYPIKYT